MFRRPLTAARALCHSSLGRHILKLFEEDRRRVEGLGRKADSVYRVLDLLRRHPIMTIPNAADQLNLTPPTIRSVVESL